MPARNWINKRSQEYTCTLGHNPLLRRRERLFYWLQLSELGSAPDSLQRSETQVNYPVTQTHISSCSSSFLSHISHLVDKVSISLLIIYSFYSSGPK